MSTTLDDLARQIPTELSRLDGRIGALEDRIGALETRVSSFASGISHARSKGARRRRTRADAARRPVWRRFTRAAASES